MLQKQFNTRRTPLRFTQFNRKGYSLFAALGKEVLIGVLSVSTLTYAKASGISTDTQLEHDSLSREEVKLDEVIVSASRAPLTALQSAKIVAVISHDDIQRAQATSINDILKLATGVDVRQRGGFGVQTDISINGGTFDQITILLNGVNLSNPQTGHNAADFPGSLADIDHIEVLEGASARVFGSSAFSGAINIVTRPEAATAVRIATEGGSYGTWGADGSVSFAPTKASLRLANQLSAGFTRSDGGTENSDFRKRRMFYQGRLRTTTVSLDWQAGIASQDYGANTFYSPKYNNQYEATRRYIGSLSADIAPWAHTGGSWLSSLHLMPTVYAHRNMDHYQLFRGEVGAKKGENLHRMDVYGATVNLGFSSLFGKTAAGIDLRREHILSTALGEKLQEQQWKAIGGSQRSYEREGRRTNTSLFLEHNVLVGGLTLSAGVLANRNTALDDRFRLYPGVDISYRPNDLWKLYASWNKALRVATFTDLYMDNVVQKGNLELKPERNSTFKLGSRYRNHGMELLASAFYSRGRDMIDWVYETEQSTRYHAMNIGKLNNMGVEVDTRWNLSQLLAPRAATNGEGRGSSQPVVLRLSYAYIHQTHTTEQPIYRSLYALEYLRHKLTAELSHPIWSHLSATWSLRWQQRMNGYHPYAKLDGKLLWNARWYELYVKADNITAHRYYDLGAVRQPGLWVMAGGSIRLKL